jgi:hypothetical protein
MAKLIINIKNERDMKDLIKRISLILSVVVIGVTLFTGCKEEAYDREMYHPVLYLLSSGSENVFTIVCPFEEPGATKYFSIGCGGSHSNSEEVVIDLEPDTVLLDSYNRINFVIDTAAFAKLLPESRYEISSYKITFPANSPEQYVGIPVTVNQSGLSPDSIYFIPVCIKSVSRYEVNPEKNNVLIRIAVENRFAEQVNTTIYYQRGTLTGGTTETPVNGSKTVQPLSRDGIRLFAGTQVQSNKSTLEEIKTYAIVVTVNADNSVSISPYANIEVEQLTQVNYNRYYTQKNAEGKDVDYFDLYYRFRTAGASSWTEIKESLERMN